MRNMFFLLIPAIVVISVSMPAWCFSQSATEGNVKYQKNSKIAAVIELPYSPDVTENAIKKYFVGKGVKADKSKGFQIFRNARLDDNNAELGDFHFKVERKSRRDKNVSIVHLLIGRPGEKVGARTNDDRYKLEEAKNFLNQFAPSVAVHNLEVEIDQQMELVKKSEKKLKALQDDQKDLEKKLQENMATQQKQMDEVAKQKSVLETMREKRKG